jgi:hypothetical protein
MRRKFWFCPDCHLWHSESECPNAIRLHYVPGSITNYNSAVDFIEWRLAQSYGGNRLCIRCDLAIAAIAASIVEFADSTMWGEKLCERYLKHPELGPYITYNIRTRYRTRLGCSE